MHLLKGLINRKRESEEGKKRQQRDGRRNRRKRMNKRERADERRPGLGSEGRG